MKDRQFSLRAVLLVAVSIAIVSVASTVLFLASPIGFSAPDVYFDDLPATASYTIKTDGTYCWAIHFDGKITASGTNASQIINWAIGNLTNGGKIFVTAGDYWVETVLVFDNPHNGTNTIIFEGEGRLTTRLLSSSTNNFIRLKNGVRVIIRDLGLKYTGANSGTSIYGDKTGTSQKSCVLSRFEQLYISGVDANHWNIHLINSMLSTISDVRCYGGNGIFLESNNTSVNPGNSELDGEIYIELRQSNTIGLKLQSSSTKLMNLIHGGGNVQVIATSGTGHTGLLVNKSNYNSFDYFFAEGCLKGIRVINTASHNSFKGPLLSTLQANGVAIEVDDSSYSNTFQNFYCGSGVGPYTAVSDACAAAGRANRFLDIFVGAANPSISKTSATIIERMGGLMMSENNGMETVANNEWVPHGLFTTPEIVDVTTKTATYGNPAVTIVVGCVNQNATHFQVSVYWTNSTVITDDAINISWHAEV